MKDASLYVLHMLECAQRIAEYTRDGQQQFLHDAKTQDAVIRNFEIIGEAAKRVPDAIRKLAPEIPWSQIGGFRDILIHQYEGVDMDEVWKRIEGDLPPLRESLQALCTELGIPEKQ